MPARKIELKFRLGDRVYSKFYERAGEVVSVKYEEWGVSAKQTCYMVRFEPDYERSCRESDLEAEEK